MNQIQNLQEYVPANNCHFKVRNMFATHGLLKMLIRDNGLAITSEELKQFTRKDGICHVTSAPYHPSTNGLAERAVQTSKASMKKLTARSIETCGQIPVLLQTHTTHYYWLGSSRTPNGTKTEEPT